MADDLATPIYNSAGLLMQWWQNIHKTYWQEEISPWFHHVKGRSHADYDTLSRFRLSLPEAFLSWESPQTSSSPVSWTSLVQPFRGIEKGNCHPPCFVYQEGPAGQMHGNQFCWQYATSYLQKPEDTHSQGIQGHSPKGEMPLGWSFGGKLHLICNERGELLNFMITPGAWWPQAFGIQCLCRVHIWKVGQWQGICRQSLFQRLFVDGIQLITKLKSNMKGALMSVSDKLLIRKRAIIETVNDELKNIAQVEHSRHRCFDNFIVNLLDAIAAYCLFPKKPCIKMYKGH